MALTQIKIYLQNRAKSRYLSIYKYKFPLDKRLNYLKKLRCYHKTIKRMFQPWLGEIFVFITGNPEA